MGKDNGIIRDGVKGGSLARVIDGKLQVRAVGGITSFSTTEVNTGQTWIDGSPIYRKVVEFGALPNNTTKVVAHGITGLLFLTSFMCITRTAGGTFRQVPFADNVLADAVDWSMDAVNIAINTRVDWSDHAATITLEYTKS